MHPLPPLMYIMLIMATFSGLLQILFLEHIITFFGGVFCYFSGVKRYFSGVKRYFSGVKKAIFGG